MSRLLITLNKNPSPLVMSLLSTHWMVKEVGSHASFFFGYRMVFNIFHFFDSLFLHSDNTISMRWVLLRICTPSTLLSTNSNISGDNRIEMYFNRIEGKWNGR